MDQSLPVRAASLRPAIIFDLDGTLIDSAPDLRHALNRLLDEEGRRALSMPEVVSMVGDGAPTLVERAFAATGPLPADLQAMVRRFLDIYEGSVAVDTRVYAGVLDTLNALRDQGLAMGICTNKPYAPTMEVLAVLDLAQYFDVVLGGDSLEVRKPNPRHVQVTLERLGGDPARSIMVGDSPNDVAAGRGAGLKVVAVSFGYSRVPPAELGADVLIDHFEQLPQAIAECMKTDA
ncbi:phosphoglycolate phosphatase [Telmatospirillum sp. J64-1]|uniref:phosphoglycolate phosphatase n=1 Tax=Telmatospirillum sp. J64-1 TaxID=2502183 RepID=UPI00115EEAF6|nr:phosphoglycolate phosphatase [Telmatospirillum sp. J64-1]